MIEPWELSTCGVYVNCEAQDQIAHPRSLIWGFAVRLQNYWVYAE